MQWSVSLAGVLQLARFRYLFGVSRPPSLSHLFVFFTYILITLPVRSAISNSSVDSISLFRFHVAVDCKKHKQQKTILRFRKFVSVYDNSAADQAITILIFFLSRSLCSSAGNYRFGLFGTERKTDVSSVQSIMRLCSARSMFASLVTGLMFHNLQILGPWQK